MYLCMYVLQIWHVHIIVTYVSTCIPIYKLTNLRRHLLYLSHAYTYHISYLHTNDIHTDIKTLHVVISLRCIYTLQAWQTAIHLYVLRAYIHCRRRKSQYICMFYVHIYMAGLANHSTCVCFTCIYTLQAWQTAIHLYVLRAYIHGRRGYLKSVGK